MVDPCGILRRTVEGLDRGPRPLHAAWRGLTDPSAVALGGALAFAFGWAVGVAWTLTAYPPEDPALLMSSARDGAGWLLARVLRFSASDDERPAVTLLGGSSTMDAVAGERALAASIAAHDGGDVEVFDLTLQGANLEDLAQLAPVAAWRAPTVTVLGVGPRTIALDPRIAASVGKRSSRIGRPLGRTAAAVQRTPLILRNLLLGPPVPRRYYEDGRLPRELWPREMAIPRRVLAGYDRHSDENLCRLAAILSRLRDRGAVPVVLQPPLSPEARQWIDPAVLDGFSRDLAGLAAQAGVPLWRLDRDATLSTDDFYDPWHVGDPAARRRFTEALGERLAALLRAEATG